MSSQSPPQEPTLATALLQLHQELKRAQCGVEDDGEGPVFSLNSGSIRPVPMHEARRRPIRRHPPWVYVPGRAASHSAGEHSV